MSKCWIKTDHVPIATEYLTSGKWYQAALCNSELGGHIKCDDGSLIFTVFGGSSHINGDWQVHYGDTPPENVIIHKSSVTNNEIGNLEWVPTVLQEPTSNDKALGYTKVASSPIIPVNEVQDVVKEIRLLYSFLYEDHTCKLSGKVKELLDKLKSWEYSVIHNTNIN